MALVLVTGGSGFIGHHLVEALRARGQRVRVLDVRAAGRARTRTLNMSTARCWTVPRSMPRFPASIRSITSPACPACGSPTSRTSTTSIVRGTEIVLAAAMKRGVSRFLHCSTESILFPYSDLNGVAAEEALQPADAMPGAYTRSKSLAEHHAAKAAAAGFPLVIGTPTMPIGAADHNLTPPHRDAVVLPAEEGAAASRLPGQSRRRPRRCHGPGADDGARPHRPALHPRRRLRPARPDPADDVGDERPRGNSGRRSRQDRRALRHHARIISDHITHRPPNGTAEGVRIALAASDLSIGKARNELGYAPRPIEPVLHETITHLLARGGQAASNAIEHHALSSRAS